MNNGAKPVKISYSVVIFAPTEAEAESGAMTARNIWSENHFELMQDTFISLPIFLNSLPFCTDRAAVRELFRYKTMTTEQAAALLPLFGEWKGTGTFHAALMSRSG